MPTKCGCRRTTSTPSTTEGEHSLSTRGFRACRSALECHESLLTLSLGSCVYSISADDGSDRYIAQVNVLPMKSVSMHILTRILRSHEDLGHLFDRVDLGHARFVLNAGTRAKYPEDAAMEGEVLKGEVTNAGDGADE